MTRKRSGATRAPDPAIGYQGPTAMGKVWPTFSPPKSCENGLANSLQPAAGKGWQPVDTMNSPSVIPDHIKSSPVRRKQTYGKKGRSVATLIGHTQHPGQEEYLKQHPSHKTTGPRRYSPSCASPSKRRKTERFVFEIEDSDEAAQDEAPPGRQTPTPRVRSTISAQSPRSVASRHSTTTAKPASQSKNTSWPASRG